jgi:hypothetical protein
MAIIVCKRILLALLFLTAPVNLSKHSAGVQTFAPKVIILNSCHPGFTWSDEEVSGVDVVEAMSSHRPYRPALGPDRPWRRSPIIRGFSMIPGW